MTDSSDYPAAHSMDTMWFAVDGDGNVAVFDSGEAGAVPIDGYVGEDYYDLLDTLRAAGHHSRVIREVGALVGKHAPPGMNDGQTTFLMILASAGMLGKEVETRGGRRIDATGAPEGAASVIVETLPTELFGRLHDAGVCLGCAWHYEDDEERPDPASFGLFRYEHASENWISGPYQLTSRPAQPFRADALPAEVAKHCLRVDRPFRDTLNLNPPELWPCDSWQPAWLESDGKTVHVFPGREKEFKKAAEDLGPEFVIARPAENSAGTPRKPWWKFW
jgi:hypothetical protein